MWIRVPCNPDSRSKKSAISLVRDPDLLYNVNTITASKGP